MEKSTYGKETESSRQQLPSTWQPNEYTLEGVYLAPVKSSNDYNPWDFMKDMEGPRTTQLNCSQIPDPERIHVG